MRLDYLYARAASGCLVAVYLCQAWHVIFGAPWMGFITTPLLVAFFVLEWRRITSTARILIGFAAGLLVVLPLMRLVDFDTVLAAANRGAYLAFFLAALGLLQDVAATSPLIRLCGEVVVNQPPGRRYSVLTIGGGLLGVLLSLGSISLLGTMIARGVDATRAKTEERISEIRLRRMTLAMVRGFASVPMWSPTTITMAIILSGLPEVTWPSLLPAGLAGTALFLSLGWLVDRLTYPRPTVRRTSDGSEPPLRALLPLIFLVVLIPGLAFIASELLSLTITSGLLVIIPFIALSWLTLQQRGEGMDDPFAAALRRVTGRSLPSLANMRSEVAIFVAAGLIAVLVAPLIDAEALGQAIAEAGLGSGWVLTITFWIMLVVSIFGINPIVSASIATEVLPHLPNIPMDQFMIAFAITAGWAVTVGAAPFSASVRLASRSIEREAGDIAYRWNGLFTIVTTVLLTAFLLIFA